MNEAIERVIISKDWITIIILMILAMLIYNKIRHPDRFERLQSIWLNNSYINSYSKVSPVLLNKFNILFYVVLILIFSILIFDVTLVYNHVESSYSLFYFLKILLYVAIFVGARLLIGVLLGILFESEREQQYFSFLKISYLSNFCILIFPLLVLGVYIDSAKYTKGLLFFSIFLVVLYYLLFIRNNSKLIINQLFYFILYLCALEIAPFVIIYKLIV